LTNANYYNDSLIQSCRFSNGIRIIYKQVPHTRILHCGIILDVGSSNEALHEQGLAHFWEHMAFKGTTRRGAYYIINRLEKVGGELNAYTTKEKMCFYASALSDYADQAVELLSDIVFHSTFPEKEMDKERTVILEEMAMYNDTPDDAIQDEFDQLIFGQHPLGHNILGTPESVKSANSDLLKQFVANNLSTERIVLSATGPLSFKQFRKIAERYLSSIPYCKSNKTKEPFLPLPPLERTVKKSITQVHCILGTYSFALHHPKRLPFFVLANLLGGPAMTSRLNLMLREKYGLVYNIEAQYQPYLDTGLFSIYFATEAQQLERSTELIAKVIKDIQQNPLTKTRLHQVKQQLKGQLAMAEEGNLSFMMMMGKSILDLGRIETLTEIFEGIDALSSIDICDMANEILAPDRFFKLTYLPENGRN
jgi:predicted Zn-dependent peptidase